jgi:Tol biopolymer transport system component
MQILKTFMRFVYIGVLLLHSTALLMHALAQAPEVPTIAFSSNPDNVAGLWLMDAKDGKNARLILEFDTIPGGIVWSPDGNKIVFHSNIDKNWDGGGDIYSVDADGQKLRRLTNHEAEDGWPTWHPGGQRIAFMSNRDGNYEIYTMNLAGQNLKNLTNDPAKDRHPDWSRDGRKIAFCSIRGKTLGDIWVMDANGDNLQNLTKTRGEDLNPRWSWDGQKIAWTSRQDGAAEIWTMDADGENIVQVTELKDPKGRRARNREPSWSPDGTLIAAMNFSVDPIFIRIHPANGNLKWEDLPVLGTQNRSPSWLDPNSVVPFSVSPLKRQVLTWGWIKQVSQDE